MHIIITHVHVCPKHVVLRKNGTASACNDPPDTITEIVRLEQFDYYNQKQNEVLYVNTENMDRLSPALFSRARLARPIYPNWTSPSP